MLQTDRETKYVQDLSIKASFISESFEPLLIRSMQNYNNHY